MKTQPTDMIHSFASTENGEGNYLGLTKIEYMAIEFAKALLSSCD